LRLRYHDVEEGLHISDAHAEGSCEVPRVLHLVEFDSFVEIGQCKDVLSFVPVSGQQNGQFFQAFQMVIVLLDQFLGFNFH
jgi:hypothetical protein